MRIFSTIMYDHPNFAAPVEVEIEYDYEPGRRGSYAPGGDSPEGPTVDIISGCIVGGEKLSDDQIIEMNKSDWFLARLIQTAEEQ